MCENYLKKCKTLFDTILTVLNRKKDPHSDHNKDLNFKIYDIS